MSNFIGFFLLWIVILVSCLRTLCLNLRSQNSSLIFFFSKSFVVLCLTFKSTIHFWVAFCINCGFSIDFFFFTKTSNCSNIICWKDYPSSIKLLLCLCQHQSSIFVWLFFFSFFFIVVDLCGSISGSLFSFIDLHVYLHQYHTVLITVATEWALKFDNVIAPTLFFFFKITLCLLVCLDFHISLRIEFLFKLAIKMHLKGIYTSWICYFNWNKNITSTILKELSGTSLHENPHANVGDKGSIPGLGRFTWHGATKPCATTTEACMPRACTPC